MKHFITIKTDVSIQHGDEAVEFFEVIQEESVNGNDAMQLSVTKNGLEANAEYISRRIEEKIRKVENIIPEN